MKLTLPKTHYRKNISLSNVPESSTCKRQPQKAQNKMDREEMVAKVEKLVKDGNGQLSLFDIRSFPKGERPTYQEENEFKEILAEVAARHNMFIESREEMGDMNYILALKS
eukprot:TRINITY_DN1483_c0_g1_i1.p1 TRINITY_DN1483_c0_g1~~TRINITY_DN1483_c0_g1_i1.p1  ORF type:complete len:111 (-),score=30.00 TRINITY_DN1483_c0_g1_i1:37-369(-)